MLLFVCFRSLDARRGRRINKEEAKEEDKGRRMTVEATGSKDGEATEKDGVEGVVGRRE